MTNLEDKVNPHISYDKMKDVTGSFNLKNIARLPHMPFTFFCFPLESRDTYGSSVQAVAHEA